MEEQVFNQGLVTTGPLDEYKLLIHPIFGQWAVVIFHLSSAADSELWVSLCSVRIVPVPFTGL